MIPETVDIAAVRRKGRGYLLRRFEDFQEVPENESHSERIQRENLIRRTRRELEAYTLFSEEELKKEEPIDYPREFFEMEAAKFAPKSIDTLATSLQDFDTGITDKHIGLFISKYLKPGKTLSDYELSRYSIKFDIVGHPIEECEQMIPSKNIGWSFYESFFNMCLMYDNSQVGIVGFEGRNSGTTITQIQGGIGKYHQLKDIWWGVALIDQIAKWSEMNGIAHTEVVSVYNNHIAQENFDTMTVASVYPEGTTFQDAINMSFEQEKKYRKRAQKHLPHPKLFPRQGHCLYDGNAQRARFTQKPDKDWKKELIIPGSPQPFPYLLAAQQSV